ncbi:MFS transporter [Aeromicrobium erythreum]|uniref:Major facilitator superfamily (MFS) profile domain-containing protein n=1 Tax=Aeromicrobium erythreum TaxID=2041 RepID=A0A0U4BGH5_9ACTN|nr:MFS transporter [Aeromicrobium erythreum]ALX04385.1 hypothetical protein AERYTH_06625 [Aeromicrobium erythreum]
MTAAPDVDPSAPAPNPDEPTSIWRGRLGRTSLGLFSLAFLVAFESLAVISVMPEVARSLDGFASYALAFALPVAVSIVSRTVAAPWIDRVGPRPALAWGVGVFAVGLLVCGTADSMTGFLVGRAVQGLGDGPIGVALWVVVAQEYPERLRPRALAVMTSAWTVPAVVGPAAAALLTHVAGWRAVFLLGPVLAAASLVVAWQALGGDRAHGRRSDDAITVTSSPLAAVAATAAVLLVSVAGQRSVAAWPWLLAAALVVLVVAVRHLVPPRTWTGGRGLPSLMSARALLMSSYFGAQVYVPLVLVELRGLSVGQAGAAISGTAFTWWLGATAVSRPERLGAALDRPLRRALLGGLSIAAGLSAVLLALVPAVPVVLVAAVWLVGGFGMGVLSSTVVTEMLGRCAPGEEAATSAAMESNDSIAESVALALGAAVFAGLLTHGLGTAVLVAFAVPAVGVTLGLLLLGRGFAR